MKQNVYNRLVHIMDDTKCEDCPFRNPCDDVEDNTSYTSICEIITKYGDKNYVS